MNRDFSNVRDCTECANYHTCRDYYGGTQYKPKPKEEKEEPESGA